MSEFDEQHKLANEDKEDLKNQLEAHKMAALEKQKQRIEEDDRLGEDEAGSKKKFDRRDPAQMEALKFRKFPFVINCITFSLSTTRYSPFHKPPVLSLHPRNVADHSSVQL